MSDNDKVKIDLIYPDGGACSCWAFRGKNLWEIIAVNGMESGAYCGGKKTCGKCKVRVEGQVNPLLEEERRHLLPEEIKAGERLACYLTVNGPMSVYLDYADLVSDAKLSLGDNRDYYKPLVEIRRIFIPGFDQEQPLPVQRRLAMVLSGCLLDISLDNMNQLAALDRAGRPTLELYANVFDGNRVKYVGRQPESALGVALDLGSTSLFAAVLDLATGETLALSTKTNLQRVYGADIISRVAYCLENEEGLGKLRQILLNNVNSMLAEMLNQLQASSANIYRLSVVGNPVMLHLFTGVNVSGFANAPYVGVFMDEWCCQASEIGIKAAEEAKLIILPQVGGFVGADAVGGLLALGSPKVSAYLFIDIGTNGEIVLCRQGKMWAASAAAGPAFEGGGISCGMRAASGAIDRVWLKDDGELAFNVLGTGAARGICGSGLIDLTACLLQGGYIDSHGIITDLAIGKLHTRQSERGREILLMGDADSTIVFNQEDIRQVQLAKAAIRSAIDILYREAGLAKEQVERVFLAGAFGNYMDPEHAVRIGLLPPVKKDIIINVGNAAAQGAIAVLLSDEKRQEARRLQEKLCYVELAARDDFQEIFLHNLDFPRN